MEENEELVRKASIVAKLLYMQTKPLIENLKKDIVKTDQQKKAYKALDGKHTIEQISQIAEYKGSRVLETMLPEWEGRGLILSIGKGPNKKYVNIENLEI